MQISSAIERRREAGLRNLQMKAECKKCGRSMYVGGLYNHQRACDGNPDRSCIVCGKDRGHNQKFCSHSCAASVTNHARKKVNACAQCGAVTSNPKFCKFSCSIAHKNAVMEQKVRSGIRSSRAAICRVLIKDQHGECAICGIYEWNGVTAPLQLDHKNGNPEDWTYSNLRFICVNCHALTPTFGAKNKGNGRSIRRARYARTGFC